ncbi:unnamed protein product [Durusdinium trenchii]|uniref:Uncharacterized protein n=1 Tax=Durusdinium trenchii TaxID=1381693 RepID=A0ABP0QWM1_9DINO
MSRQTGRSAQICRLMWRCSSTRHHLQPSKAEESRAEVVSELLDLCRSSPALKSDVFRSLAEQKEGELAFALLEEIRKDGKIKLNASNYTVGISSCARSKLTLHALRLLKEMPTARVQLSVISHNAAISACEKGRRWQQALELFEDICRAELQRSVFSFSSAISACEKGQQWVVALKLFDTMLEVKVQPNVISYNAAISACEKGRQWQQALQFFEAIPKPEVISYSAAISACEKGGQWQQALNLFESLPQSKTVPDVKMYNATISACEKGGRWQEALTVFQAMPKAKLQHDVISYCAAISAIERGAEWQQALQLFDIMTNAHIQPDIVAYNALFDSLAIHNTELGRLLFAQSNVPVLLAVRRSVAREIDLHNLSEGSVHLALLHWLSTAVTKELEQLALSASHTLAESGFPLHAERAERAAHTHNGRDAVLTRCSLSCIIITGYGKSRKDWQRRNVQQAALKFFQDLELNASPLPDNPGRLHVVLTQRDLPVLRGVGRFGR